MQSRLDVCAVTLLRQREKLLREIGKGNRVIETTAAAIAMLRGFRLLSGPVGQMAGSVGEAALLRANQGMARWQESRRLFVSAKEKTGTVCPFTPFSRELALCRLKPELGALLRRERSPMPDVAGPLLPTAALAGRVECRGGRNVLTRIRLIGDKSLQNFTETYEK
jgi:hypothetical protein